MPHCKIDKKYLEETNKNLCSDEIQRQVHDECLGAYEKMRIERLEVDIDNVRGEVGMEPVEIPSNFNLLV